MEPSRITLLTSVTAALMLSSVGAASAQQPPGRLAVYYGWPSFVDGAVSDIGNAVDIFNDYDVVVFGSGLEYPQAQVGGTTPAPNEVCPYSGLDQNDNPIANPDYLPTPGFNACPVNLCVTGGNCFQNLCDQNGHGDHAATETIIRQLVPNTQVYGYVSIGGEATNRRCGNQVRPLTWTEIKASIDGWKDMGVTGIFLDEAEFGFGATRRRQNLTIDYIKRIDVDNDGTPGDLRIFVNGYDPEDVFGANTLREHPKIHGHLARIDYSANSATARVTYQPPGTNHWLWEQEPLLWEGDFVQIVLDAPQPGACPAPCPFEGDFDVDYNDASSFDISINPIQPNDFDHFAWVKLLVNAEGAAPKITADDAYMLEHYQIINNAYVDPATWINRANRARAYKDLHSMNVAALTSAVCDQNCATCFDQWKFDYAWWSTVLYGFDHMGWGEPNGFSATGPCENKLPMRTRPVLTPNFRTMAGPMGDPDPTNELQGLASVLGEGNDAGGARIVNLADPGDAHDAATKAYVDNAGAGDDDWNVVAAGIFGNNIYSAVTGNVGIGTSQPKAKLHIQSRPVISGGSWVFPEVLISESPNSFFATSSGLTLSSESIRFADVPIIGGWPMLWPTIEYGSHKSSIEVNSWGSSGDLTIANESSDMPLVVEIGGTERFRVLENGGVRIPGLPTLASGTAVIALGPDGTLGLQGSSSQYKKDIEPLDVTVRDVMKLRPVSFLWKADNTSGVGLIAEEVAEVFPNLVSFDADNNAVSVNYQLLSVYLLKSLQFQQSEIERLRIAIKDLKAKK